MKAENLLSVLKDVLNNYNQVRTELTEHYKKSVNKNISYTKNQKKHDDAKTLSHFPLKYASDFSDIDIFSKDKSKDKLILKKMHMGCTYSIGQGRASGLPWIIFAEPYQYNNHQIQATSGMYLVYLFSYDLSKVYLSLSLGATTLKHLKNTTHISLTTYANDLLDMIQSHSSDIFSGIDITGNNIKTRDENVINLLPNNDNYVSSSTKNYANDYSRVSN